jgi:arylsulfatase A-like enzyme
MPNLKQYIKEPGLTFTRNYVTESLCCPSRVTILRGQYPHNTGILGNVYPRGGFSKFYELGGENSTIATWLQAGGYRTMFAGKYLNQYPQPPPGITLSDVYVPPGWTEWYGWIDVGYRYFNYDIIENGLRVHYGSADQDYLTDVLSRKAIDFLDRTDGPFFMYLAPAAPHQPATPAPRHRTLFGNISARRTPSFNEADISDKPWPYRDVPLRTAAQINQIDELHRKRLRSMMAVDDMIKALVDKLQQKGQLSNTYIFFTSDNGFHMGEHRFAPGKNTAYEEDIQVPLIVVGPGVRPGRQDHITLNNDLAPTFADLAGVSIPANYVVDGRSIRPLFSATAPVQSWRTNFLTETSFNYFLGGLRTISPTANSLYVEYTLNGQRASSFNREFYDLAVDPYQLQNGYDGARRPLINHLSAHLASLRTCAGLSCRAAEDAVIGPPRIWANGIVNAPIMSRVSLRVR